LSVKTAHSRQGQAMNSPPSAAARCGARREQPRAVRHLAAHAPRAGQFCWERELPSTSFSRSASLLRSIFLHNSLCEIAQAVGWYQRTLRRFSGSIQRRLIRLTSWLIRPMLTLMPGKRVPDRSCVPRFEMHLPSTREPEAELVPAEPSQCGDCPIFLCAARQTRNQRIGCLEPIWRSRQPTSDGAAAVCGAS